MEVAYIMLALGGDRGNTVPKFVSAAEIIVLRAIHGDESVFDIKPAGDQPLDPRAELKRLKETYKGAQDGDGRSIIDNVYPGAAPALPLSIDEIGLPEEFFLATERAHPAGGGPKRGRPRKIAQAPVPAAAPAPQAQDADDGDDEMDLPEIPPDAEPADVLA